MSNLSILSDDEYGRICAVIPHGIITGYFRQYPKEFAKIRPGFRATALRPDDAVKLMVRCRQNGFISSFVERIVNDWLMQINKVITDYQKEGEIETSAYIHALSQSFFADNTSAYFKLIDKKFSDEEINLIRDTIELLKSYNEKIHSLEDELKRTLQELEECRRTNHSASIKSKRQLEESSSQIKRLTEKVKELQKIELLFKDAQRDIEKSKNENEGLKKQNTSLSKKMAELQRKFDDVTKEKNELEISIRRKMEEERAEEVLSSISAVKPIHPIDIDEFVDYLGYNLSSIGVNNTSDLPIANLLSSYTSNILFNGKPIVCDKAISNTLVGCIANALIGTPNVSRIHFSSDITEKSLRSFLKSSGRIVILDNFLGNFNDSVLLSIIDDCKSKIVFLTYSYSKTLRYISEEIYAYCFFIGATKIPELSIGALPSEDPSIIDEEEYDPEPRYHNNRFSVVLGNILKELGYIEKVINAKMIDVSNERRLCEILAFDIIPYCFDIRSSNPLNYSQTLQKHIKKSSYAKLLERWLDA